MAPWKPPTGGFFLSAPDPKIARLKFRRGARARHDRRVQGGVRALRRERARSSRRSAGHGESTVTTLTSGCGLRNRASTTSCKHRARKSKRGVSKCGPFPDRHEARACRQYKSPRATSALPWVWLLEKPPSGGFFFYRFNSDPGSQFFSTGRQGGGEGLRRRIIATLDRNYLFSNLRTSAARSWPACMRSEKSEPESTSCTPIAMWRSRSSAVYRPPMPGNLPCLRQAAMTRR